MTKLKSLQPATKWEEGLPLGDGAFGALVFGGIAKERIVFNHENLYLPDDTPPVYQDNSRVFQDVKREVLDGNYKKAETMLQDAYTAAPEDSPYQPLCELIIHSDIKGEKVKYARRLDFETAEAVVSWEADGVHYRRRQFISRETHTFVLRIENSADLPMTSTFSLHERLHGKAETSAFAKAHYEVFHEVTENAIRFEGRYKSGKSFGASLKIMTDGRLSTEEDMINCEGYTHLTLYVTGYAFSTPGHPETDEYETLFAGHRSIQEKLFNRVHVDFGYSSDKSTEEFLLESSYEKPDPAFYELMFNYSRYLFLACAVGGNYPPNLQGIWNGDYRPAWNSDFHNDENIQMCMWQALPQGMFESVETYMAYYMRCLDDYRDNARLNFGAKGIAAPMGQTVNGKTHEDGMWCVFPGLAGWIAQLFFQYYLYTGDKKALAEKIVPFLKEVADFYLSYCTVIDGEYQFIPSMSPENEPIIRARNDTDKQDPNKRPSIVAINATFDVAVAKEVFSNLIKGCEELGMDSSVYREALGRLPAYKLNADGAIKEWLNDELEDNYRHRHLSHIYPFFPGCEIKEHTDPVLYEAIRVATEKRLSIGITAQSGWSLVHMSNVFARLGMAEKALECLRILLRTSVLNNLFTLHNDFRPQGNTLCWDEDFSPFQIDANLGFASTVIEMFLYSDVGYIKIAPAVPSLFANAKLSGLLAKGNIRVDITMRDGVASAVLTTDREMRVKVDMNGKMHDIVLEKGETVLAGCSL